jgi:hypothetical protein
MQERKTYPSYAGLPKGHYAFTSFYRRHLQCFILMTKFNHQLSMCKRFFAEFCVFRELSASMRDAS